MELDKLKELLATLREAGVLYYQQGETTIHLGHITNESWSPPAPAEKEETPYDHPSLGLGDIRHAFE